MEELNIDYNNIEPFDYSELFQNLTKLKVLSIDYNRLLCKFLIEFAQIISTKQFFLLNDTYIFGFGCGFRRQVMANSLHLKLDPNQEYQNSVLVAGMIVFLILFLLLVFGVYMYFSKSGKFLRVQKNHEDVYGSAPISFR